VWTSLSDTGLPVLRDLPPGTQTVYIGLCLPPAYTGAPGLYEIQIRDNTNEIVRTLTGTHSGATPLSPSTCR
jgi:hypothetical protein